MMQAMALLGFFVAGFGFGLFVAFTVRHRETTAFTFNNECEWTDWRSGFRPAEEHRTGIYAESASRSDPPA